jgi:hypothetical protein
VTSLAFASAGGWLVMSRDPNCAGVRRSILWLKRPACGILGSLQLVECSFDVINRASQPNPDVARDLRVRRGDRFEQRATTAEELAERFEKARRARSLAPRAEG